MVRLINASTWTHHNQAGHDASRLSPARWFTDGAPSSSGLSLLGASDEWLLPLTRSISLPPAQALVVTLVLEGQASIGVGSGQPNHCSAMTATQHITPCDTVLSIFNPSNHDAAHLFQLWLAPTGRQFHDWGETTTLSLCSKAAWQPMPLHGYLPVNECPGAPPTRLWLGMLATGQRQRFSLHPSGEGSGWLHVITGSVTCNGNSLDAGDGALLEAEPTLRLHAKRPSRVIFAENCDARGANYNSLIP